MRIRDASSIVLYKEENGKPHILMGRRAAAHKFMPNVYVFPGGRVDYADRFAAIGKDYCDETLDLVLQKMAGRPSPLRARMMGLAAIRETFEEVGLRIGCRSETIKPARQTIWQDFSREGKAPDLSRLKLIARAITPPGQSRRFDTRFFITDFTEEAAKQKIRTNGELEDVQWIPLENTHELKIHFITQQILKAAREHLLTNGKAAAPFYRARRGTHTRAKQITLLRPFQPPQAGEDIHRP